MDNRMGTRTNNYNCGTCGLKNFQCPGHLGYMDLNYPVINFLFIEDVKKWLKVICYNCGQLVVKPVTNGAKGDILYDTADIFGQNKVYNCQYCGKDQPNIGKDSKNEFDDLSQQLLTHLYKGSNEDQVYRVICSELIIRYGLSVL